MLITFIAMSSVPADELAASETPLALVLERTAVGAAGGTIIKLGIMVSVLGATLYSLYVIYAVGIQYLFLSVLFYGIGSLLFIGAKREEKQQPKRWEWAVIIMLLTGSTGIIAGIMTGGIEL